MQARLKDLLKIGDAKIQGKKVKVKKLAKKAGLKNKKIIFNSDRAYLYVYYTNSHPDRPKPLSRT